MEVLENDGREELHERVGPEELPHHVEHAPDHRVPAPQAPLHIETAGCEHIEKTGCEHIEGTDTTGFEPIRGTEATAPEAPLHIETTGCEHIETTECEHI